MKTKYAGYMGKIMLVDLSTETVSEYPWSDEQRELYLGGKIMAARILCDHLTGKETAFSEENWVVISTGPLTGTGAPSSARFNISALSPQTGILASSNCGGSFGFHLKKAGYDALILKGKCRGRRWLEISEDSFLFHDADALWGTKVSECQEQLAKRTGKTKFGKLCIGPAGENLVKYAGIISDERAAGRTGLGAVLGWKGLKAITATGSKTVPIHDKEKTTQWCKKWFAYLQGHPLTGSQLPKVGTAGLVSSMQMRGLLRIESGIKEKQFEAATMRDVLEQLAVCGIDRRNLNGCVILINGNSASKRSKLQDGDTVVLMSPVAGGRKENCNGNALSTGSIMVPHLSERAEDRQLLYGLPDAQVSGRPRQDQGAGCIPEGKER